MEQELLQEMINDRDKKIREVEAKIDRKEAKMMNCQEELEQIISDMADQKLERRRAIEDLTKRRDEIRKKVQALEQDVKSQTGSLHTYAEIVRETSHDAVDSSYVLRMQAQLCKAMHSMGMLEHQLSMVNASSNDVIKAYKDTINGVVEEKSKIELSLMNDLVGIDNDVRRIKDDYKGKLDQKNQQLQDFEMSLNFTANAPKEELDEDEMQEYMEELNEAIAEMTEKTEAQLKEIQDLRAPLGEPAGSELTGDAVNGDEPSSEGLDDSTGGALNGTQELEPKSPEGNDGPNGMHKEEPVDEEPEMTNEESKRL